MQAKELYRVIVIGPTGAGKSQFCNFIQRDITNSKNKVSDELESCTKDPKSNFFTRNDTNYEFIDTAGNSDSANDDTKNLNLLINYIKKKESIDYITLLLKFGERITGDTKSFLKTLGKIFTANEFYSHLCVFFTKFPLNPTKKEIEKKDKFIEQINIILKEIFQIDKNMHLPDIKVYFIDTEIDENDNTYHEKSQETINIMMELMKLDVMKNGSINTTNFDITGENCKLRKENENKFIEELVKKIEEEKLKKKKEEEEKIKIKKELQKLKMNEEKRKKKVEDLEIILKKQEEERKKYDVLIQKFEEEERKKKEMQRLIEEKAREKGIEIERLDGKINEYWSTSKDMAGIGLIYSAGSFGLAYALDIIGFTSVVNYLFYPFILGLGSIGFAAIPALIAGGYVLKKGFT